MPRFYAAKNAYGSTTDIGFSNTWSVYAFTSRKIRDEWVDEHCSHNISTRAIKRREIGRYIGYPKPFSGEAFVIDTKYPQEDREGAYGVVGIEVPWSISERVYRAD